MARRLIGLDIGTNAVTVAEVRPGEPPRLDLFGQVVLRRVAAVEAGGLQVAAVDLVPLALIRSLAGAARDRALVGAAVAGHEATDATGGVALAERGTGGAEGIVSFGGGVTAIAVHEL